MAYKKSTDTRNVILKAAKELFYEKGFEKTTIKDISKRSNTNQGLLHYYFNGKYRIAYHFIDLFHKKAFASFMSNFNNEYDDYLLLTLIINRYQSKCLSSYPKDYQFYISVYQKYRVDNIVINNLDKALRYYGKQATLNELRIASIASSTIWGQLYAAQGGNFTLSNDEIYDATDIIRFTYLGFDREFILTQIDVANEIVDSIPTCEIRIFD